MLESVERSRGGGDTLAGLKRALQGVAPAGEDAVRVDQIRALEEIKAVAAAIQTEVIAEFVDSQRAAQRAAGVRAERCERGIASQVGLAKRCSPQRASRQVGFAKIAHELPHTFAQLRDGRTTEWRAMLVARETGWLSREHRAEVDAQVGPRLESLGDKATVDTVKAAAYRCDPRGMVRRLGHAESERGVSARPVPDLMCRVSALLPMRDGVAVNTTLIRDADAIKGAGDGRSRRQIMADLLTERVTGRSVADGTPVEVQVTIGIDTLLTPDTTTHADADCHCGPTAAHTQPADDTDASSAAAADASDRGECGDVGETADVPVGDDGEAVTADEPTDHDDDQGAGEDQRADTGSSNAPTPTPGREQRAAPRAGVCPKPWLRDEPAYLHGYGPIPAPLAREWILNSTAPVWLRRLFTHPGTGQLIAMESRRRLFTRAQRAFITARDQVCRTPWCGAPIRHIDHIQPAAEGGPTSTGNGQGTCAACNYAKEAPGWRARPTADGTVITSTPTGHTYVSEPPDPPGAPPGRERSPVVRVLANIIYIHTHDRAA